MLLSLRYKTVPIAWLGLFLLLFGKLMAQEPVKQVLPNTVNSAFNEYHVLVSQGGDSLWFSRANFAGNTGGKVDRGDVWLSTRHDGQWQAAKRLPKSINNAGQNAVIGFGNSGAGLWLAGKYKQPADRFDLQGVSFINVWGAKPMPSHIQYMSARGKHVSMHVAGQGKILLIAMRGFKSLGKEDLYVSFWQTQTRSWSEPMNLGKDVNTGMQEMTPWLAPDGQTLYFASNGHGGYGGRDIFKAKRLDNTWQKWSTPENLGPQVNSEGVELSYSYSVTSGQAYFISTQNSAGFGDVYTLAIEEDSLENKPALPAEANDTIVPVTEPKEQLYTFIGQVVNKESKAPVDSGMVWIRQGTDSLGTLTNVNGQFVLKWPKGNQSTTVMAQKQGFLLFELALPAVTLKGDTLTTQITLVPEQKGTTITLDNVLFKLGTDELVPEANEAINVLVGIMNNNPALRIQLSGHTDNRGDAEANMRLSLSRAETVKAALVQKGIDPMRVITRGYGGYRPKVPNNSEANRRLNRRVEFTIID